MEHPGRKGENRDVCACVCVCMKEREKENTNDGAPEMVTSSEKRTC